MPIQSGGHWENNRGQRNAFQTVLPHTRLPALRRQGCQGRMGRSAHVEHFVGTWLQLLQRRMRPRSGEDGRTGSGDQEGAQAPKSALGEVGSAGRAWAFRRAVSRISMAVTKEQPAPRQPVVNCPMPWYSPAPGCIGDRSADCAEIAGWPPLPEPERRTTRRRRFTRQPDSSDLRCRFNRWPLPSQ